ncbi:MAG: hypothetical protein HZB16_20390 [Armatimonadetes bacterium]|nr:hypothetical protein [Armatimonadota bacterium]
MNKRERRRAQRETTRAARETARARRAVAPRRPLVKRQRAKAAPVAQWVWARGAESVGTLLGVICALVCVLICVIVVSVAEVGWADPEPDRGLFAPLALLLGGACVVGRMAQIALLPTWRLSMASDGLVLAARIGRSRTVPWTEVSEVKDFALTYRGPEQVRFRTGRRRGVFITVTPHTAPFIARLRRVVGRQGRVNWLDDTYVDVPDTALSLAHLTGEEADVDRALSLAEPPVEQATDA